MTLDTHEKKKLFAKANELMVLHDVKQIDVRRHAEEEFPSAFEGKPIKASTVSNYFTKPEEFVGPLTPVELLIAARQLLYAKGVDCSSLYPDTENENTNIYLSLCQFAGIKPSQIKEKSDLIGHYKRYWPSAFEKGKIAVGYLRIKESIHGHLVTEERLPYEFEEDGSHKVQRYEGYVVSNREHILLIAKGTDIVFPRVSVLRFKNSDGDKEMVGGVLGVHSINGMSICARKMLTKKVEQETVPKDWENLDQIKDFGIGIHEKQHIPKSVLNNLKPEKTDGLILF